MDNHTFNQTIRSLNIKYRDIFGHIPRITDYSCTREEYILALKQATEKFITLDKILVPYEKVNSSKNIG